MLKPHGQTSLFSPDASAPVQHDTIHCGHCERIVKTKAGSASTVYILSTLEQWVDHNGPHCSIRHTEVPGAFCKTCMRAICRRCHEVVQTCTPFEQKIDQMEA